MRVHTSATRSLLPLLGMFALLACSGKVGTPKAVAATKSGKVSFNVGEFVQLVADGSNDPDNRALNYEWTFQSRPAGSQSPMIDSTTPTPSFMADAPGKYMVRLIVSNTVVVSEPADVEIQVAQCAPDANSGPRVTGLDASVPLDAPTFSDGAGRPRPHVGALVTLTPTATVQRYCGSIAVQPITFTWSLTQRPEGSQAAFDDPGGDSPKFTMDKNGTYGISVIAHDARGVASASFSVQLRTTDCGVNPVSTVITTDDHGSTIDLTTSPAARQPVGSFVQFPVGARIVTDDNDTNKCPARFQRIASFTYRVAAGPSANAATLTRLSGDGVIPTGSTSFQAVKSGDLAVQVDGVAVNAAGNRAQASSAFAYFNAAPCSAPVFTVNAPAAVFKGDRVDLAATLGAGTCPANLNPVAFKWALTPRPGSTATLSQQGASTTSFIADVFGGAFTVLATATDAQGNTSIPVTTTIPVSDCGSRTPQVSFTIAAGAAPFDPYALSATAVINPDDDPSCGAFMQAPYTLTYSVISPANAKYSISASSLTVAAGATPPSVAFTPGQSGTFRVQLVAVGSKGAVSAPFVRDILVTCTRPLTSPPIVVSFAGSPPTDGAPVRDPSTTPIRVYRDDRVTLTTAAASACFSTTNAGLTYDWTLTGPSSTSHVTTASASFTVDQPGGAYSASVVVKDAAGNASAPQSVSLQAETCGANPIAAQINIGGGLKPFDDYGFSAGMVAPRTTFSDDDVGSKCPNRFANQYTFAWSIPGQTPNVGYIFSPASGQSVTFTPGGNAVYEVKLTITGASQHAEFFKQLTVSCPDVVPKTGPISLVGPFESTYPGKFFRDDLVQLSVNNPISLCFSTAPIASYLWSLTRPLGSTDTAFNQTAARPTFTADVAAGRWTATVVVVDKLGNRSNPTTQDFFAESCGINSVSVSIASPTRPTGTPGNLPFDPYAFSASARSDDDNLSKCPAHFLQTYTFAFGVSEVPINTHTSLSPVSSGPIASNAGAVTTLKPGGNGTYTIGATATGSGISHIVGSATRDQLVNCIDPSPTKVTAPSISSVIPPAGDTFARSPGQFFRDDTLTLTASGSSTCFSPGNTTFTYAWTLSPVNPPTFNNANTQTPSLIVNTSGGSYSARVTATDSIANSSLPSSQTFTASDCGFKPIAMLAIAQSFASTTAQRPQDPRTLTVNPAAGTTAPFSDDSAPAVCPARFSPTYAFAWTVTPSGTTLPNPADGRTTTFSPAASTNYTVSVTVSGNGQSRSTSTSVDATCTLAVDAVVKKVNNVLFGGGAIFKGDALTLGINVTNSCLTGATYSPVVGSPPPPPGWTLEQPAGTTAIEAFDNATLLEPTFTPLQFSKDYVAKVTIKDSQTTPNVSNAASRTIHVSGCGNPANPPVVKLIEARQSFASIRQQLVSLETTPDLHPLDVIMSCIAAAASCDVSGAEGPLAAPARAGNTTKFPVPFYLDEGAAGRHNPITLRVHITDQAGTPPADACPDFGYAALHLIAPATSMAAATPVTPLPSATTRVANGVAGAITLSFSADVGASRASCATPPCTLTPATYQPAIDIKAGPTSFTGILGPSMPVRGRDDATLSSVTHCGQNKPSVTFTPATSPIVVGVPVQLIATAPILADADNAVLTLTAAPTPSSAGCGLEETITYHWSATVVPTGSVFGFIRGANETPTVNTTSETGTSFVGRSAASTYTVKLNADDGTNRTSADATNTYTTP
jgi:hypothetical protein